MAARERKFSPYVSAGAFMATRRRKIARRENQPNSDAEEEQLISMVSSSASLTNPHTGVTGKRKRSEKDNTASLDSTDRPLSTVPAQDISLNVGGKIFVTSIATLTSALKPWLGYPDSMLAAMFSGRYAVARDSNGAVFIDRSPRHFGTVLDFLRTGRLNLPSTAAEVFELEEEFKYYGLPFPPDAYLGIPGSYTIAQKLALSSCTNRFLLYPPECADRVLSLEDLEGDGGAVLRVYFIATGESEGIPFSTVDYNLASRHITCNALFRAFAASVSEERFRIILYNVETNSLKHVADVVVKMPDAEARAVSNDYCCFEGRKSQDPTEYLLEVFCFKRKRIVHRFTEPETVVEINFRANYMLALAPWRFWGADLVTGQKIFCFPFPASHTPMYIVPSIAPHPFVRYQDHVVWYDLRAGAVKAYASFPDQLSPSMAYGRFVIMRAKESGKPPQSLDASTGTFTQICRDVKLPLDVGTVSVRMRGFNLFQQAENNCVYIWKPTVHIAAGDL